MGHCESYQYGLEVETTLAKVLDNTSTYLKFHVVISDSNLAFHSEWDNLSKTNTNLTGSEVANSAAEIMLKEVKLGLQSPGARTYQNMKEIQRIRKQATKSVFWKYLHHSQYTTVLE